MRLGKWLLALFMVVAVSGSIYGLADKPQGKKKILFFSPSFGFRHSVVQRPTTGELAHAERVLKEFAGKAGYEVHVSQDCNDLNNPDAYKQYAAIVLYTTGNPPIHRDGLLKYLRDGGALIGIHTATDTFHSDGGCGPKWPEYVRTIGGAFRTHGEQRKVAIKVEDRDNPATKALPADWQILDEIYLFRDFSRDNCHVLLSIDTEKMKDADLAALQMKKGEDYPVAWTREEGKGRVFYTSLGHREDVWTNPVWQNHLLGGMAWALEKGGK